MRSRWVWRTVVLTLTAACVACIAIWTGSCYKATELIASAEATRYTNYTDKHESWRLSYCGEAIALDETTSTIYLSTNVTKNTSPEELIEELKIKGRNLKLYLVEDEAFYDLPNAIAQGHLFTLLMIDSTGGCAKYNVVFTTLPVLAMEEYKADGETINGEFCLWNPDGDGKRETEVISGQAEWHRRGHSIYYEAKASWKMSIRNGIGKRSELDLLQLGADDDWILNPMVNDDTKLKEKIAMITWNELAEQNSWDASMSRGKYIELLLNGKYRGVYLLQRRVDENYLGLKDEILFKGSSISSPETLRDAYELVYSPVSEILAYEAVESVLESMALLNLKNFIDINCFIQIYGLLDNCRLWNMYYLLYPVENDYHCLLVPWDTDMAFGVSWDEDVGFVYTGEGTLQKHLVRREYDDMLVLYPDLHERIAERWFELREDVLSLENIQSIVEEAKTELCDSGAYERDKSVWRERYDGQDTQETLEQWICDRLQWCDEYYSS